MKKLKNKNYEILISSNDMENGKKILKDAGIKDKGFIALNAGGNWNLKRWPAEDFAKLGDKIFERFNIPIVLTGAEKDIALAEKILRLQV